ncbi:MAG: OsmC family protein [Anaerolineales bacterium]
MGNLGQDPGISPMELILVGLAGCTGIDVISTLRKQRQPLENLKIRVRGKRADLSEEKYCSVSAMMQTTAKISTSYQVIISDERKELLVQK